MGMVHVPANLCERVCVCMYVCMYVSLMVSHTRRVDRNGSRYLLGDHLGNLTMLLLERGDANNNNNATVVDMKLEYLGPVSIHRQSHEVSCTFPAGLFSSSLLISD